MRNVAGGRAIEERFCWTGCWCIFLIMKNVFLRFWNTYFWVSKNALRLRKVRVRNVVRAIEERFCRTGWWCMGREGGTDVIATNAHPLLSKVYFKKKSKKISKRNPKKFRKKSKKFQREIWKCSPTPLKGIFHIFLCYLPYTLSLSNLFLAA